jgi:hypothetical protein
MMRIVHRHKINLASLALVPLIVLTTSWRIGHRARQSRLGAFDQGGYTTVQGARSLPCTAQAFEFGRCATDDRFLYRRHQFEPGQFRRPPPLRSHTDSEQPYPCQPDRGHATMMAPIASLFESIAK